MRIFYSPKAAEYASPGHPEAPRRVASTAEYLQERGYKLTEPSRVEDGEILRVHTKNHLEALRKGNFFDPDTPSLRGIEEYAMLSAGGALSAMRSALSGETAFSLMRPPGHHAGKESVTGFCYLNNIAIAVCDALSSKNVKRAAILDVDVHHGNGTQDIFLGEKNILYVSLHQSPLYPGTGLRSEENCLNFPLPPETEDVNYLKVLETACQKIREFSPGLLAVSAGFDTYEGDPLANFRLSKDCYKAIGEKIAALKLPAFSILEGGYSGEIPILIYNFLAGLA